MMTIPLQFAGKLVENDILSKVSKERADAFRKEVAELPDYLTVELKEDRYVGQDNKKRVEQGVFVRLDDALVQQSQRYLPDGRGESLISTTKLLHRIFPALQRKREVAILESLLTSGVGWAKSIQKDVEAWQKNR